MGNPFFETPFFKTKLPPKKCRKVIIKDAWKWKFRFSSLGPSGGLKLILKAVFDQVLYNYYSKCFVERFVSLLDIRTRTSTTWKGAWWSWPILQILAMAKTQYVESNKCTKLSQTLFVMFVTFKRPALVHVTPLPLYFLVSLPPEQKGRVTNTVITVRPECAPQYWADLDRTREKCHNKYKGQDGSSYFSQYATYIQVSTECCNLIWSYDSQVTLVCFLADPG